MIEEINWTQAKEIVQPHNPELVKIIDDLSPSQELSLIKVRYPFASVIADNNCLYLPINSTTTAKITDEHIDPKWQQKLGYQAVPLGIIAKNSLEMFREINDMVLPISLMGPDKGLSVGIAESCGSTAAYTMTSGARSLYMLPKITKSSAHSKLQKLYGIQAPCPRRLIDHYPIFKELYASPTFNSTWECEILFFSNKWHEQLQQDDPAWQPFKHYLSKQALAHYAISHRKVLLDVVWQKVSNVINNHELKPAPYIIDTLKHIVAMSLGLVPGSRPIKGDNFAGPLNEIQDIYLNVYGLDGYIPSIMAPYSFNSSEDEPVYYTMQSPMLLSTIPNSRSASSNIEDMRELIQLVNYMKDIDYGNLLLNNIPFNEHLNKIEFSYYHADIYAYGCDIVSTKKMADKDEGLLYQPASSGDLKFSENGSFVRGCVKVARKHGLMA